jgi:hypothetical protein
MGSFGVPFRRFSPSLPPRQHTHLSDYVVVGLFIEPCDLTLILLRFPNCPTRFDPPPGALNRAQRAPSQTASLEFVQKPRQPSFSYLTDFLSFGSLSFPLQ